MTQHLRHSSWLINSPVSAFYNKFLLYQRHCYTVDIPFGMVIAMGRRNWYKMEYWKLLVASRAVPTSPYPSLMFHPTKSKSFGFILNFSNFLSSSVSFITYHLCHILICRFLCSNNRIISPSSQYSIFMINFTSLQKFYSLFELSE